MFAKNQLIEIEITDLTSEGNGVGHYGEERFAVFVPNTAPGDRAEVRIVKVLKTYAFGRLEKLLYPSQDRIPSECPVSHLCGGCSLRHLSYEAECRIKNGWVEDCLNRLGDIHIPLEPFQPSPDRNRYRNKAQYPISRDEKGHYHLGFYANRSHRIVDCDDCLLQPEIFSQIAGAFRGFLKQYQIPAYDEITGKGLLRHLYLRIGENILLARDLQTDWGIDTMGYLRMDVFTLKAQVIEVKDKPSHPVGKIFMDAFGNFPTYTDRGIRKRALLGIGKLDLGAIEKLLPKTEGIEVLGGSSDHTILDVEDYKGELKVGDVLDFDLCYATMLFLTSCKSVNMRYFDGDQEVFE